MSQQQQEPSSQPEPEKVLEVTEGNKSEKEARKRRVGTPAVNTIN
jgi:hypothetical protein